MLKKVFKWFINILTIILLIILAIAIYGRVQMLFTHKTYPTYFGYTLFQVASGSMKPTLTIDDVILVNTNKQEIQVNDIISYKKDGAIITHRVLFIDNEKLTVKGDNNNTIDSPISKSDVIGKVIKIFPELKIWQDILTDPKILIFMFLTLILFDFALSYQPKEKKDDENAEEKIEIKKIEPKEKEITTEEMLELTRKIDLREINELLSKEDEIKLENKEVIKLQEKINRNNLELPKLKEKEKDFLEYTMRLDLKEIQKQIEKKVK